jgi:hypothetical protein
MRANDGPLVTVRNRIEVVSPQARLAHRTG